jgi:hypothetical protein
MGKNKVFYWLIHFLCLPLQPPSRSFGIPAEEVKPPPTAALLQEAGK